MSKKIVIIGGSAAGPKAAGRARRLDETADVIIIQREPELAMATCGYPYYAQGIVKRRDHLMKKPGYFSSAKNITARANSEALEIDRKARRLICRDTVSGKIFEQPYDKLIIATGSTPRAMGVAGEALSGVTTLHTMADNDYFQRICKEKAVSNAVVIGGGLVGMEACEALALSGVHVTVAEFSDQILPFLDWDMARLAQNHCAEKGVDMRVKTEVEKFSGKNGALETVHFTDGSHIQCRLAIVAAGVKPNVALAKAAGLSMGTLGGIETDPYMRTSDPDIYAAGDCVEKRSRITGKPVLAPMGDLANLEGRVAGENAAMGDSATFNGILHTGICRIFDFVAGSTGLNETQAKSANLNSISGLCAGSDKPFFMGPGSLISRMTADRTDGTLLGFQCVGTGDVNRQLASAAAALCGRLSLDDISGLDMPYAPPFSPAIDHFIAAAHVLSNKARKLFSSVSAVETKQMTDKNKTAEKNHSLFILDVRDPFEYKMRRLNIGETNIPLYSLRRRLDQLPRDKRAAIICFCFVSARAYEASRILEANGYENVRVMEGSIAAWPFETENGARA